MILTPKGSQYTETSFFEKIEQSEGNGVFSRSADSRDKKKSADSLSNYNFPRNLSSRILLNQSSAKELPVVLNKSLMSNSLMEENMNNCKNDDEKTLLKLKQENLRRNRPNEVG